MRSMLMRSLRVTLVLFVAAPTFATNGVLEINQACAVQAGCSSGDDPGFPVTVSQAGSYVLTSNLVVPEDVGGIEVTASDVTLDMRGFGIEGPDPVFFTSSSTGIKATADWVTVHNGSVLDFHIGVDLLSYSSVEGVQVARNLSLGVGVGAMSMVSNCNVDEQAGADGISILAGDGSIIYNNHGNGGDGLGASGSVIRGNSEVTNSGDMGAGNKSLVVGNYLWAADLFLSAGSSYRANRIANPELDYVSGGIDAGDNLCKLFLSGNRSGWVACRSCPAGSLC